MDHIKVSIKNFQFNKKEAFFLERHVWDKYTETNERQVSHTARLMIADLAMHSALSLAYEVDTASDIKETFVFSTSNYNDFFMLTIGESSSAFVPLQQYEMSEVLSVFDIAEKNSKGKQFGDSNGISAEAILHPLRCFLIGMQNKLNGNITLGNDNSVSIILTIPGNNKFHININFVMPK